VSKGPNRRNPCDFSDPSDLQGGCRGGGDPAGCGVGGFRVLGFAAGEMIEFVFMATSDVPLSPSPTRCTFSPPPKLRRTIRDSPRRREGHEEMRMRRLKGTQGRHKGDLGNKGEMVDANRGTLFSETGSANWKR